MKIVELDAGLERIEPDREQRLRHHLADRLRDSPRGQQIAAPQPQARGRLVDRREERQPVDVIDVEMAKEDIRIGRAPRFDQSAQRPQSRARIEDQQAVAAPHLDARSIAAIARQLRLRTGEAAAHPPEPHADPGFRSPVSGRELRPGRFGRQALRYHGRGTFMTMGHCSQP